MSEFKKYDHVMIKDLSQCPGISHFPHSTDAIVLNTYADEFGGDDQDMCLFVKDHGEVCWYAPDTVDLIEHDRKDLLDEWKKEKAETEKRESNLDWIFEHGQEIVNGKEFSGNVAAALFQCLMPGRSMWGSNGEGFVYYINAMQTFEYAKPYLEKNDKAGWLLFATTFRELAKKKKEEDSNA